jgi:hypothetical protein
MTIHKPVVVLLILEEKKTYTTKMMRININHYVLLLVYYIA